MLGFLFSYWYVKGKRDLQSILGGLDPMPPLFADSGAFTAWSNGVTIPVQEYGEWCLAWAHLFDHFANLDDKGSVKKGLANLEVLEALGVPNLLPVFHGGEPFDVLEDFCERYDYVALGGIAGGSMAAKNPMALGWLARCFDIAERHGARLHGFGMTNWDVMLRFPWRSVDSSSIGSGYRFGQVSVYNSYTRRWLKWRVGDRAAWGKNGWLVRDYEMEPADFKDSRSAACTRAMIELGTRSMARAVRDLPSDLQMYVVDDLGKQAGLRRVVEFNKANKELVA